MLSPSRKAKDRRFEWEFRFSLLIGIILMIALVVLAWRIYTHYAIAPSRKEVPVDIGVMVATAALALFTAFLFLAAAVTARFARTEISTSTAVSSANLTLQLDNRFNSDRALRIRHGAVMFLVKKRHLEDEVPCDYDIS